jgi:hypothetical protein
MSTPNPPADEEPVSLEWRLAVVMEPLRNELRRNAARWTILSALEVEDANTQSDVNDAVRSRVLSLKSRLRRELVERTTATLLSAQVLLELGGERLEKRDAATYSAWRRERLANAPHDSLEAFTHYLQETREESQMLAAELRARNNERRPLVDLAGLAGRYIHLEHTQNPVTLDRFARTGHARLSLEESARSRSTSVADMWGQFQKAIVAAKESIPWDRFEEVLQENLCLLEEEAAAWLKDPPGSPRPS